MKTRFLSTPSRSTSAGFSLIEVLVATALLVMIVSMIGFVFRQSTMTWDSGIRRAEGSTQVRAVVGAIARDLRAAVDAREFGQTQSFSDTSLKFVALLEPKNKTKQRVPTLVTYTGGDTVRRKTQRLKCSGGSWSAGTGEDSVLMEKTSADCAVDITFDTNGGYESSDGLPAYVSIYAELITEESFSGLTVRSYGRDGIEGNRDDIVVK